MKLDERDRQILAMLKADARRPNASIARDLGISEATVRRRLNTMIEDEVLSVRAVPNAEQLGLRTSALIGIDVEPSRMGNVTETLEARDEVLFLGTCAGRYDLFIRVLVSDLAGLRVFIEEHLTKVPGIRKTETLILLDMKKEWTGG